MKILIFTVFSLVVSVASANDLAKALGAALQEAEQNHAAKQVALEVDTSKIEQAKFGKDRSPKVVELGAVPAVDRSTYSTKDEADEQVVEDSDDISKEINDN